jgi:uncharacterized membrane protein YfcA
VDFETAILAILFLVIAVLYAAVGQAGATGYLAAMALFHLAPATMKITALALNLVVAAIGTFQFWRGGHLSLRAFYPFGVLGIPFSLAGGAVQLPSHYYYPVVGAILLLSGLQMVRAAFMRGDKDVPAPERPPFLGALIAGGAIGFVSGTTGTGGGIFLAPVILSMNWVSMRRTAAVTAAYNLLNSGAALVGAFRILGEAPPALPIWIAVVAVGGMMGAYMRQPPSARKRPALYSRRHIAGGRRQACALLIELLPRPRIA